MGCERKEVGWEAPVGVVRIETRPMNMHKCLYEAAKIAQSSPSAVNYIFSYYYYMYMCYYYYCVCVHVISKICAATFVRLLSSAHVVKRVLSNLKLIMNM